MHYNHPHTGVGSWVHVYDLATGADVLRFQPFVGFKKPFFIRYQFSPNLKKNVIIIGTEQVLRFVEYLSRLHIPVG